MLIGIVLLVYRLDIKERSGHDFLRSRNRDGCGHWLERLVRQLGHVQPNGCQPNGTQAIE